VLNVHTYAALPEGIRKHPWDRTFPEDPRSPFLQSVDNIIAWRNRHAPGKQVWVTEFGWDACTNEAMSRRKDWALKLNWTGVSDLQQAQYLVRAFLLLAARDVERAYLYFYDDNDEPSVHASSGITRKFEPKSSYWAICQLQDLLGDYRFKRVLTAENGVYIYAFVHPGGAQRWVAWSTAGIDVSLDLSKIVANPSSLQQQRMATGPNHAPALPVERSILLNGSSIYLSPRQ
jgi:hypothetical protein